MPEGQPLRPFCPSDLGERLDFFRADRPWDTNSSDNAAGVECLAEDLELGFREDRRKLVDLQAVAQVGLVHAVAEHRVGVGDAADWGRAGLAKQLLPDVRDAA